MHEVHGYEPASATFASGERPEEGESIMQDINGGYDEAQWERNREAYLQRRSETHAAMQQAILDRCNETRERIVATITVIPPEQIVPFVLAMVDMHNGLIHDIFRIHGFLDEAKTIEAVPYDPENHHIISGGIVRGPRNEWMVHEMSDHSGRMVFELGRPPLPPPEPEVVPEPVAVRKGLFSRWAGNGRKSVYMI